MTDISGMLNQTISVEKILSRNRDNTYTYDTAVEYPARVQEKINITKDAEGTEVVSDKTIYVAADIDYNDRITVDGVADPTILSISHVHDFDGNFVYCKVMI
jgi:hypothetical protein